MNSSITIWIHTQLHSIVKNNSASGSSKYCCIPHSIGLRAEAVNSSYSLTDNILLVDIHHITHKLMKEAKQS